MSIDIKKLFTSFHPGKPLDYSIPEDRQKYVDFSSFRNSAVENLRDTITFQPDVPTCQFLSGHIGCGKTTELLRLKSSLEEEGFEVVYFACSDYLDVGDVDVSDIYLSIIDRLTESLSFLDVEIPNKLQELFYEAYNIIRKQVEISVEENIPGMGQALSDIERGLCSNSDFNSESLIRKVITRIKDNHSLRLVLREFLTPRLKLIIEAFNTDFINYINEELKAIGKRGLVVIVDNLDRMDDRIFENKKSQQEYLFFERGETLCELEFHIVYTFPHRLRFSDDYLKFSQRYGKNIEIITPIPISYSDGETSGRGLFLMKQVLLSRVFPDLDPQERFEKINQLFQHKEDLLRICQISGGHPRALIRLIYSCLRKEDPPFSRKTIEEMIRQRQGEITKAITEEELKLLYEIDRNSNVLISASNKYLLDALLLYEYQYRGETWFQINPLLRSVLESRKDYEAFDKTLLRVKELLERTGAVIHKKQKWLKVKSFMGPLSTYTPLPVMFFESPDDKSVTDLIQFIKEVEDSHPGHNTVGLLFYQKPPNTLAIFEIAQARVRNQQVIIPVPISALEQASLDEKAAIGMISKYVCRYMPGADLFNDRNAISDSLSFYGRSNLLNVLEQDLSRFQSVGIFGLRKSGKTSVLLQLAMSMCRYPVVHIDLQPFAGKTRYGVEIFNHILQGLSSLTQADNNSPLEFPLFDDSLPTSSLTTEFMRRFQQLSERLFKLGYDKPAVVFLDEIERILPSTLDSSDDVKQSIEEFNALFGTFRALNQEQHLLSLLVADLHPDCNNINHWHIPGVPTNPVYQFFKEVFVKPFVEEDTGTMLAQIAQLMGIKFEQGIVQQIHQLSGGHPFIARQLASLICNRVTNKQKTLEGELITVQSASRYLNRPFSYSDLGDYFEKNIWDDLINRQHRGYQEAGAAMDILKVLACNADARDGVSFENLMSLLMGIYTENDCERVLRWLEAVGLVVRTELEDDDYYAAKVGLMTQWLRRMMRPEEVNKWRST